MYDTKGQSCAVKTTYVFKQDDRLLFDLQYSTPLLYNLLTTNKSLVRLPVTIPLESG